MPVLSEETAVIEDRIGISMNADMIDGSLERFDEHLGHIAGSGARCAELILHGLDVVVNGSLDLVQLGKIRRIAARYPLRFSLHLPYLLNLLDHERKGEFAEVFRAGLRFASELEIPIVVYHASSADLSRAGPEGSSSGRRRRKDRKEIWRALLLEDAETLSRMADEAATLGVSIGVENPVRYDIARVYSYGVFPDELAAHVARIGRKNLGITLDFGHLYLSSVRFNFDYLDAVRVLASHAIHTHIHDNFGKPDAGEPYIQRLPYGRGDLHLPPGAGIAPLEPALTALARTGYDGLLMLEIEFRLFPCFADHVAAARKLFDAAGLSAR